MNNPAFSADDLLSSFFDLSPICIWVKDLNNTIVRINKAAAALEKKAVEEMIGKSCFELYPEDRAQAFWRDDQEVIKAGEPKLNFYELHTIPGTDDSIWLQVNKMPIKNKDGIVTGILVYAIDVNDIKIAEEQTRDREFRTRQLMDIAPFPIVISSLKKFVYINQAALNLLGYTLDEALLVKPENIYFDETQRENVIQELWQKGEVKGKEITFLRKDGEQVYGILSAIKIEYNNQPCSYNVFYDISELKRNQNQLTQIAEEFRVVFENSNDAILWADSDTGIIINCNRSAEKLLLVKKEDIIGRPHWEIHPKKDRRMYQKLFADIGSTKPGGLDLEVENSKGFIIPVSISVNTVDIEKKRITQAIIVDISEKKKAAQMLSQERNILRSLIDNVPAQIFIKDLDSRFVVANQWVANNLNTSSPEEVVGKSDFDFFPKEIAQGYFNEEQDIIQTQKPVINQENKRVNDGDVSYFEVSKIPFYDSHGKVIGIVGVSREITDRKRAEAEIRESEAKFRILAENMKDVIWQLSSEMTFTYLSPSFYQLTGFEPSQFIGKPLWSLFTQESAEELFNLLTTRKSIENAEERKSSLSIEAAQYHANDSIIWTEIVSNPVFDETGELLHFQGITRDITKRKLAELALQESQARLSVVISNAPLVLFQIDKDGIFRFSDGKGLERLGLKPNQVVGGSVYEYYKDLPEILDQINRALSGKIVREELVVNNVYFEIYYNPIFNQEGEVTSIIGIGIDITERKLVQNALLESEQRFKTLFHEMTEGVALHELVFDKDNSPVNYRINEVNPAFAIQSGLESKDPANQLVTDYYNISTPPYLEEYSKIAMYGGKLNFETYFEPLEKFLKISVVSPGKNRFATVFEDVTAQKKHEKELKDKNEELERFTYTVSHDLKSPLVTIKGFIGMLEQDLINRHEENIKDDMQRIKSATDKMTNLLNDLLELSRIGRYINPPVKVPMLSIINEAVELLSGIIKERSVKIEIDQNMPDVYVDRQRMVEVWLNLIENAAKFSGKEQTSEIKIKYFKEDTKFIFSISDNGIGIDKKYFNTIFGLFNKLDNKSNGTGIGLALVKRIIEVHGGEIHVESEGIGKGTKFTFSIPVKAVKN